MEMSLKKLIPKFFEKIKSNGKFSEIESSIKNDGTPVTNIDFYINNAFYSFCNEHNLDIPIFSEESPLPDSRLNIFPCFVIDPVDGTKDLIKGNGEWSISIAYLNSLSISDSENTGWVYRPSKDKLYCVDSGVSEPRRADDPLRVLVSRTEFDDGLFDNLKDVGIFNVEPMGSIALKLGILGCGDCDLVITFRPKSLWDIAAGVTINNRNGGVFYSGNFDSEVTRFQSELTYKSPMLFGGKSSIDKLETVFKLLKTQR